MAGCGATGRAMMLRWKIPLWLGFKRVMGSGLMAELLVVESVHFHRL